MPPDRPIKAWPQARTARRCRSVTVTPGALSAQRRSVCRPDAPAAVARAIAPMGVAAEQPVLARRPLTHILKEVPESPGSPPALTQGWPVPPGSSRIGGITTRHQHSAPRLVQVPFGWVVGRTALGCRAVALQAPTRPAPALSHVPGSHSDLPAATTSTAPKDNPASSHHSHDRQPAEGLSYGLRSPAHAISFRALAHRIRGSIETRGNRRKTGSGSATGRPVGSPTGGSTSRLALSVLGS
jgi:hypothetical protein